jgi:hypothetical protein
MRLIAFCDDEPRDAKQHDAKPHEARSAKPKDETATRDTVPQKPKASHGYSEVNGSVLPDVELRH